MSVKAKDFVSWASSNKGIQNKGRVKSVHKGKVPAVPVKVEGTDLDPAARVEMYAKVKDGDGYEPTGNYIGILSSKLSLIDSLPEPALTEAVVDGSFDQIRRIVQDAIEDRLEQQVADAGADPTDVYVWVSDIGPDWAVYCCGAGAVDDTYKVSYSLDDQNAVTLGEPVQVLATTTYALVAPDEPDNVIPLSESKKDHDRISGQLLEAKGTDDDGNRIFGVRIIAAGDSKNGRRYPQAVLETAASLYEGAKAFDHHRSEAELKSSTITGLVGYYRDVQAAGDGLYADLHLLPSAKHTAEALDASLAAQTAGLKPLVGISHDVYADYRVITDSGKRLHEATQIVSVNSADVVADPAAGGRATRMVAGGITITGKETPVDESELQEALNSLTPEQLHALGYTAIEQDAPSTEATRLERDGIFGRLAIESAMKTEGVPANFVEAVTRLLPEKFTEAELSKHVPQIKDVFGAIERTGLTPKVPAAKVLQESFDKKVERLNATFGVTADGKAVAPDYRKGYSSFKEAWADFTEQPLHVRLGDSDINRKILSESVGGGAGFDSQYSERSTESVSSGTWNLVLGDSITRRMVAEYQQPSLSTWQNIVSSTPPINDFRTQRIERLGGYGVLPAVNQGAPYQPLTSPTNEEATYSISKRGGTEDLTLETIANDDLRAITRIPVKLGLAAAQTLFRFVWDLLNTNATCTFDSTALFAAGHNNADAGNTLSGTNMSVGRKRMRKQTAYGDSTDLLSITPKFLVVPSSLEELAWQLCTSAVALPSAAPVGAAANQPNIHQGTVPVVVDYFDATASATWYLVADPVMVPTIEVGFYQGRQDPDLLVQSDAQVGSVFTADKITYKIRHIYSGTVLDYRGFYRGN